MSVTEKEQAPLSPAQTAALRDGVQTAVRDGTAGRRERGGGGRASMIFAYERSRVSPPRMRGMFTISA